jgi:integrase
MPKANTGPRLAVNKRTGNYEVRWTEKGRSRSVSSGTASLNEAQDFLAGFLTAPRRDNGAPDRLTVSDAIDIYTTNHISKLDELTRRSVVSALKPCAAFFRGVPVMKCDNALAADFVVARRDGRIRGFSPASPSTIRNSLTYLAAAIRHCEENGAVGKGVWPGFSLPAASPPREQWIRPQEYLRIMRTVRVLTHPNPYQRLTRIYRFLMIAFHTAARKTAICELRWDQVDMDHGLIRFNPPGRPQTRKRRPTVPMSKKLHAMMKRAYSERLPKSEYVLDSPATIDAAFTGLMERAGLPWVTPHTIRHTWATWAAQRGVSMYEIAGILGDTIQTVTENYLKYCPDHLRHAVEIDILNGVSRSVTPQNRHISGGH